MELKQLFGMRVLKSGLAVTLSALLGMTPIIVSPFFTVMSTVLAMQNTVKNSFELGKNRILGTVLGGIIGFIFAHLDLALPYYFQPLVLAFALMVSIIICTRLKLGNAMAITMTVCASLIVGIENGEFDLMSATIFRTTDTIVGILVSLGVNYFIKPPNYWGNLSEEIEKIESMTMSILKNILLSHTFNLDDLSKEINNLDKVYGQVNADRKYHKNPVSASKVRAVVEACHEILFHLKSIKRLESENPLMASIDEIERIHIYRAFYSQKEIDLENVDSIFEYHIYQVLSQIRILNSTLDKLHEKDGLGA